MKKFLLVFAVILFAGCAKEAKETVKADNANFSVELLFEVDGCKMYRFYDNGRYRYFSNCKGSTQWSESCGKNCTTDFSISTN